MANRMRLPAGYSELAPDLGGILRARRKGENIALKNLAADVGITRESLCRIECGRRWPSYDTLLRIMEELNLELDKVAIRGNGDRQARREPTNDREEYLQHIGANLRRGREADGLSLRALAADCGMSYAKLSRIERGESRYSDVLEEHPDDAKLDHGRRRMRFSHEKLAELAAKGRSPS